MLNSMYSCESWKLTKSRENKNSKWYKGQWKEFNSNKSKRRKKVKIAERTVQEKEYHRNGVKTKRDVKNIAKRKKNDRLKGCLIDSQLVAHRVRKKNRDNMKT